MTRRRRIVSQIVLPVILGGAYGFVSSVQNRNPYYEPGAPPAPLGAAWGWQPSSVWLPSYALCVVPKNGYGIGRTRSGFLFRNDDDRRRYTFASTALGAVLGAMVAAGCIGMLRIRAASLPMRRRDVPVSPASDGKAGGESP